MLLMKFISAGCEIDQNLWNSRILGEKGLLLSLRRDVSWELFG